MKKFYDAIPPYIQADEDKVLFDGANMTSEGGRVSSMDTAYLDTWQEMTQAEAEAILAQDEEITDEEFGAMVQEVL